MLIYTVFFGMIIKVPSNGVPYALFFFTGYIPFILFSEGFARSAASILNNASIMKKVYFPKIIMPISTVISPLIDFCIMCSLLLVLMILFGYYPTIKFLMFPVVIGMILFVSMTVALWVSALNTQYRDFAYAITHILQLWMYASPLVYPSNLIPYPFSIIYNLNPMVCIIDMMRWIVTGSAFPQISTFFSFVIVLIGFFGGWIYFKHVETKLVDVV
jgi:lipopolysaccharide transport system permease protein